MSEQESLNISPDGKVIKIDYIDEKTARVDCQIKFTNEFQRDLFYDNLSSIITNFKSKLARLGFDQFLDTEIDIIQNIAQYSAIIKHVYPDYWPEGGDIKNMLQIGNEIGKLYLQNKESRLTADDIRKQIELNLIKVRPGSEILNDGTLRLKLNGDIILPIKNNISTRSMQALLNGKVSRNELWTYQCEENGEENILYGDNGLMLMGQLFTRDLESVIEDYFHSDARVGDKYSNGFYPFEFTGERLTEGLHKKIIQHTDLAIYQPHIRKHLYSISDIPNIDIKSSTFSFGNLNIKRTGDGQFEIDSWPTSENMFEFGQMSKKGELKKLVLNCDTVDYTYFPTQEEHSRIKDLVNIGVEVCWKNPKNNEIWFYNQGVFMPNSLTSRFNKLSKSRMAAAFYISSLNLTEEEKKQIDNAMEGFKKFNGGDGMVYTGGGGGGMETCNMLAQEKKLLSVGICWDVPIEPVNDYLDCVSNFGKHDITSRQDAIDKSAEVIIAGPGGFGTDLELMIANVNTKLRLHPYRPIILIGEKDYSKFIERVKDINDRGRGGSMGQKIIDNIYLSKDGSDVYEILCNHYKVNQNSGEIL